MVDNKKRLNRWYFGGVSSAAAVCVTHPLDLLKVHLQTQQLPRKTIVQTIFEIYKAGGIRLASIICCTVIRIDLKYFFIF